jgi:hypothetical protein
VDRSKLLLPPPITAVLTVPVGSILGDAAAAIDYRPVEWLVVGHKSFMFLICIAPLLDNDIV